MTEKRETPSVIFFGTPDYVIPIVDSLHKNFNLIAVVTGPDQKVGRHQVITPTPVKRISQERGILVLTPEKLNEQFIEELEKLKPDLIIVASYGKIIPQKVLDIPKFGALNVHPSLLPKYRGATPIQSAILHGDTSTGLSIIKMDAQMDHGPLIYQEEVPLSKSDTFQSLAISLFGKSAEILQKVIPDFIEGKITESEQIHDQAVFCSLLKKDDGFFDIENPPSKEQLDRMIRAYYPWPNAWTKWKGKIVKLFPENMIQMEGKKPVKEEDFYRGYPDFPLKKENKA